MPIHWLVRNVFFVQATDSFFAAMLGMYSSMSPRVLSRNLLRNELRKIVRYK